MEDFETVQRAGIVASCQAHDIFAKALNVRTVLIRTLTYTNQKLVSMGIVFFKIEKHCIMFII
jgi:hypothetical protein